MRTREFLPIRLGALSVLAAALFCVQGGVALSKDFKSFKLKTLEGSEKSLPDYLNKATLVTFFFPTCKFCNAEFPHLQKIYETYKGRGLSMVSINIFPEEESLIADWQKTNQYTIPVLVGAKLEAIEKDYDVKMTPTHFLLDSKGRIVLKQAGYKPGDEKALEGKIQKAVSLQP